MKDNSQTSWRRALAFGLTLAALILTIGMAKAQAQAITEGFEDITQLPGRGWQTINNSSPVGTTSWFQGNSATFAAQAGPTNSYIAANFNATTGTNTISVWLLTPTRTTLKNGDVYSFYTRTTTGNVYPDRLQVRLSTNGSSSNVGSTPTSVGDFTTLLLDINPSYATGGYPETWTQFTITLSGLPAAGVSGRLAFRYFVENGGPTGANSNYIGVDTFSYTPASSTPVRAVLDFNGDGKTDYVTVRSAGATSQSTWQINTGAGQLGYAWGTGVGFGTGDRAVPVDFDGDGKTDVAVWRPTGYGDPARSYFFILQSSTNTFRQDQFGSQNDDPSVVADYDGDGKADPAVFRRGASAGAPSFWYYRPSTAPTTIVGVQWGQGNASTVGGDYPVPGDYDGDGKADFVVQRPNSGGGSLQATYFVRFATGTTQTFYFGTGSDINAPGDYDGDGKTDFALVRSVGGQFQWNIRSSSTGNFSTFTFGSSATDFITQGDYNGDGKTDIAVWRSGTFYVLPTGGSTTISFPWGASGDYPAASYNTH
jgi:hypothetical protein